jgi:hypothetical protein
MYAQEHLGLNCHLNHPHTSEIENAASFPSHSLTTTGTFARVQLTDYWDGFIPGQTETPHSKIWQEGKAKLDKPLVSWEAFCTNPKRNIFYQN